MIRKTFQFLPGVGEKKEKNILQHAKNWSDFLDRQLPGISARAKNAYDIEIRRAGQALRENDSAYFTGKLRPIENWRLYDVFAEEAIFLDVESSGSSLGSYITVLGLYDGINTKTMVNGMNLDLAVLKKELHKAKLIITFNGSSFDIPFLEKKYPGLVPCIPHIDVRHLCAKVGLTGGLKEIETQLGICRPNRIVEKLYSGDPIKLWRTYMATGDEYYLGLLIEYNEEDVINLKTIAERVIKKLSVG
ncbi:MAG: ribonuclease H-like domain-containing protein [Nanoarchaeota archaeon]|nr:ribonuclease H-like domain-containing protein [Nanoarchaeota archaeon]